MVDVVIPGTIHYGKEYISSGFQEEKIEAVEFDPVMALDFFAGCLGGCAGVIVGHPFDTIKVKLQMQDFKNPVYRGTWDCFKKIIKHESVAGLYKGVTPPMSGVALVNAIVFGVYGNVQRSMSEPNSLQSHFLAGAAAGLAQSVVVSPVELVKLRIQVDSRSCSPLDCLIKTFNLGGVKAVFKGLGVTGARDFFGYGLYFLTYEALTRSSPGSDPLGTASMLLAGGVSGTVSWIFTYPLDVVKTRLQVDPGKYSSFSDCLIKLVKHEGWKSLSRGLAPTLLRAFPTNAVTFTVVTWIFRLADMGMSSLENIKTEIVSSFEALAISNSTLVKGMVEKSANNKSSNLSWESMDEIENSSNFTNKLDPQKIIDYPTDLNQNVSEAFRKEQEEHLQESVRENYEANLFSQEVEGYRNVR